MLVGAGAFYLFEEFILEGYLLETYFYTSYFLGPTVLLMLYVVDRVGQLTGRATAVTGTSLVLVLLAPLVLEPAVGHLEAWTIPLVPVLILVFGLCVWLAPKLRWTALAAAAGLALTPIVLPLLSPQDVPLAEGQPYRREPFYGSSMFSWDQELLDAYGLAGEFVQMVPESSDEPGTVVFWYPDDELSNLMGSTFLWKTTNLNAELPGLPELDPRAVAQLTGRTPRFVVVLSQDRALVDDGVRKSPSS